jgi:hypothetical protein
MPVISGALQRSVVVHPYGPSSAGVVSVSGVGWRKETRLVMKTPPLVMICWRVVWVGCDQGVDEKRMASATTSTSRL